MELFVRSQNKILFSKVDELIIQEHAEIEDFAICNGKYVFGVYKTKDRCLEILDEIQNEIQTASRDYIIWGADEKHMLEETDLIEINRQLQKYGVVNVPKEVKAEFVPKGSQVVIYQMPEK